jgi:hypothetical protein
VADRYLQESGSPDGFLLEDGSGVLLLENDPVPNDGARRPSWLQHKRFRGSLRDSSAVAGVSNDISALGSLTITGAADLDAIGTLVAAGSLAITGAADLDAIGTLTAAGSLVINGAADLDATGTLVAAGSLVITGVADLDATGTLTAAGTLVINGAADLTGVANDITALGTLSITGTADLDATGTLTAAGSLVISGVADLTGIVGDLVTTRHAGRKRRKRRYIVEVDGQEFEVENQQQAVAVLDRAREAAQQAAEAQAEEVLAKVTPRATRVGRANTIVLKPPVIDGPAELSAEMARAREAIAKTYADAALAAELRLLLLLQQMQEDEETILLLM